MGAAIVSPIVQEHDDASSNRHPPHLLFEHGPFGKPVPTFPGHALEAFHIAAVRASAQTAFARLATASASRNRRVPQSFSRLHNKKSPGRCRGFDLTGGKIAPKSILRDHRAAEGIVQADTQDV